MKKSYTNIGNFVKSARAEKGLSQAELTEKLGYTNAQFISNIERGICSLPPTKIDLFCKLLQVKKEAIKDALRKDFEDSIKDI